MRVVRWVACGQSHEDGALLSILSIEPSTLGSQTPEPVFLGFSFLRGLVESIFVQVKDL